LKDFIAVLMSLFRVAIGTKGLEIDVVIGTAFGPADFVVDLEGELWAKSRLTAGARPVLSGGYF
jgi:hypothetical protein